MFSDLLRHLGLNRPAHRTARRQTRRIGLERLETREVPATVFAIAPGNQLLRFDSATPGTIQSTTAITGLGAGESVRGIDFRPRTGQLFASTVATGMANSAVTTYRLDPLTGAATLIGATPVITGGGDFPGGYDFNPTVDRLRFVNVNLINLRLNPNNGAVAGTDTGLTAGSTIIAEAYDRNFDRQNNAGDVGTLGTTLYGIDRASSSLVRQGGIDGTPSPNGGVITAVGPLGFTLRNNVTDDGGFDIMDSTANGGLGTAFAGLTANDNVTRLYTIDLTTGAATSLGAIGNGATQVFSLAVVPDSALVVGSGLGANADVRSLNPSNGAVLKTFIGAEPGSQGPFVGFQGGVRVASGDVNRDGIPDVIVSAIAPQGHVKVFDGVTGVQLSGNPLGSIFAFPNFQGTVNVGSADVNRDGFDDVLVVANGSNGAVKVFSGKDGSLLASFLAYQNFLGNVTISGADFNNDGQAEIVTVAAINGHLKVFNADGTPFTSATLPNFVNSFFAFSPYLGDVSVATGDLNGDGVPDFALASGPGVPLNVRVVNGTNGQNLSSFLVTGFGANYTGGGNVGVSDVNGDGRYEVVVTPNLGTQANVLAFDAFGASIGNPFAAFANFQGGATVAGKRF
jgi:hypothetical protein